MAQQESALPIMEHINEIRRRLIWIIIVVAVISGVSFFFAEDIIDILKSTADADIKLQATQPTETISTFFKLSVYCGLAAATPVTLYHIVMFIRPALTPSERRYVYTLVPGVLLSFVAGVFFAYYVLVPPALEFLDRFGTGVADQDWRVSDYVTMMIRLFLAIGLSFETPIAIYFLSKIGILNPHRLARFRRWWIVVAFIIAGIITPTMDPINQTIVAVPLILLYEVGILLSKIAQKGKNA